MEPKPLSKQEREYNQKQRAQPPYVERLVAAERYWREKAIKNGSCFINSRGDAQCDYCDAVSPGIKLPDEGGMVNRYRSGEPITHKPDCPLLLAQECVRSAAMTCYDVALLQFQSRRAGVLLICLPVTWIEYDELRSDPEFWKYSRVDELGIMVCGVYISPDLEC